MLTVGETMVVVGLEAGSQVHYSCEISDVQYWTWVNADTIAFITDGAVLHWMVGEGIYSTVTTFPIL